MSTKKSKYENWEKFRKLDHPKKRVEAHGSIKQAGIETVKDALIGALIGGSFGAVINKPVVSGSIGLAFTGFGHYYGSTTASAFGLGMMTSATVQAVDHVIHSVTPQPNPVVNGMDGFGERFQAFKTGMMQLFKNKKAGEGTNGVGDVQYFTYPNKELEGTGNDLDLAALDDIERQLAESGEEYEQKTMGMLTSENGIGEMDISERNF